MDSLDKSNNRSHFKHYQLVYYALAFIAVGIIFDIASNIYELNYKTVSTVVDGKVHAVQVIDVPIWVSVIKIICNVLYTGAIASLVYFFISLKLENEHNELERLKIEQFKNSVNEDVFSAVFKMMMPEEIFEVVRKDLIESRAVRKKAHWDFAFSEITNQRGVVDGIKCVTITNYELHNLSNEILKEPIKIRIAQISSTDECIVTACCRDSDSQILAEYKKGDEEARDDSTGFRYTNDVDNNDIELIYLADIKAKSFISSTLVRETIYSASHVNDSQGTLYPTIDLKITASYPDGYEFKLVPFFSASLTKDFSLATKCSYSVKGGLLPHQSIVFSLEKIG